MLTPEIWMEIVKTAGIFGTAIIAGFGLLKSRKNSRAIREVQKTVNGKSEVALAAAYDDGRRNVIPQVLVIDDDDNDQELQAIILRRCGCEVFQAKRGLDAEQLILSRIRPFRGFPFDWVILDVKLGSGETGLDVLRILDRLAPQMPVVILTGYPNHPQMPEILSQLRMVLAKPLTEEHVRRMQSWFGLDMKGTK